MLIFLRRLRHIIFGCSYRLDIGKAVSGDRIKRCYLCGQTALFIGRKARKISEKEALELVEYLD